MPYLGELKSISQVLLDYRIAVKAHDVRRSLRTGTDTGVCSNRRTRCYPPGGAWDNALLNAVKAHNAEPPELHIDPMPLRPTSLFDSPPPPPFHPLRPLGLKQDEPPPPIPMLPNPESYSPGTATGRIATEMFARQGVHLDRLQSVGDLMARLSKPRKV